MQQDLWFLPPPCMVSYLFTTHEDILVVAMIAISRKIIILDFNKTDLYTMLGIGDLILALAASYYLMVQSRKWRVRP